MGWQLRSEWYRALGRLLHNGLPLERCVDVLPKRGAYAAFPPVLSRSINEHGTTLHTALERCGEHPLAVALIAAGEHSGRLPQACEVISQLGDTFVAQRNAVIKRSIYPLVVLHIALILPASVLAFLDQVPAWMPLGLPLLFWGVVLLISVLLWFWHRSGLLARIALRWPLRLLSIPYSIMLSAKVLEGGIQAGMLYGPALTMTAEASGNRVLAERYRICAADLERGDLESLSSAVERCGWPATYLELVRVGEHGGSLETALHRCHVIARERFETMLTIASRMLSGGFYTFTVIVVIIAVVSMMLSYISGIQAVMPR